MNKEISPNQPSTHSFGTHLREALVQQLTPDTVLRTYLQDIYRSPEKRQDILQWMDRVSSMPNGVMLHMTRGILDRSILDNGLGELDVHKRPMKTLWWRTVGGPNDLPLKFFLHTYKNAENPDTRKEYIASLDIFGKLEARIRRFNTMDDVAFQNMLLGKMIRRICRSLIEISAHKFGSSRDKVFAFTNITKQEGEIATHSFVPQSLQTENGRVWIGPKDLFFMGQLKNESPGEFAVRVTDCLLRMPLPIHAAPAPPHL